MPPPGRHDAGDDSVERLALPLADAGDLDPLLERVGNARVVLLGEASHGTSEFYTWRAAITRRLVEEKGFSFVAVEGDWPDCYRVNCSVTCAPDAPDDPAKVLTGFDRWPTWMWANEEVGAFTRWLRAHNAGRAGQDRVGFYGLDVYSLWDSLRALVGYVRAHEPGQLETALAAVRCFEPYAEDPQAYARATRLVPTSCEQPVVTMLSELLSEPRRTAGDLGGSDQDARFDAEQNALAAAGAEAYYRSMVHGGPESWNVRDTHMADTLDRLLGHHGRRRGAAAAKAVVWEHNTHVGDARFTDMADAGMVNLGQLVRARHGEDQSVLVGFGTHQGTVVAATGWGEATRLMPVPPARAGSAEALLHDRVRWPAALFVVPADRPRWLAEPRDHRAIGVVYHPAAERWGNYVPTVLGRRYDAFCWFDETHGLAPLHGVHPTGGEQETWPYGG
ncbi:MAG: erythromycin esterase family protein [Actinomycetota bacterium]|nr:erythromycin esterase family protein [Actinomycetota bacterium]